MEDVTFTRWKIYFNENIFCENFARNWLEATKDEKFIAKRILHKIFVSQMMSNSHIFVPLSSEAPQNSIITRY